MKAGIVEGGWGSAEGRRGSEGWVDRVVKVVTRVWGRFFKKCQKSSKKSPHKISKSVLKQWQQSIMAVTILVLATIWRRKSGFWILMGKSELNTQLLVSLGSVVHVSKFSLQTVESPPGETVEKETTTSEHGPIFTSHLLFKTEHQTANPIDWSKTFKAKMFFAFL